MNDNLIFKYGKDINWSIPVLFQYEAVWGCIYHLFKNYGVNLPQVNAFGAPAINWGGGRAPMLRDEINSKMMLRIYNYLNDANAVPALTFTYTELTKDDLKDRYANYFLDIALEAKAHFIICSDLLKNYIKEKDPQAYVVASVIKPALEFQGADNIKNWSVEKETNFYNNLLKEYDMVVVRPEFSKGALLENPDLIDDISRIEVLINQPCIQNCPRMPQHYKHLQKMRLGEGTNEPFKCIKHDLPISPELYKNTLAHSEDVVQKLVDIGVKHLKIQGRGVDNVAQSHALMLFGQMFKQSGSNYLLVEDILHGALDREIERFNNFLQNGVKQQGM